MEVFRKRFKNFISTVICLGLLSGCGAVFNNFAKINTPLVVAYDMFSGNFNPFFADCAHDRDVIGMTQIGLMTTDRNGSVVYRAIEGETIPYNGTVYFYKGPANLKVTLNDDGTATYQARIRDDVKFSDGQSMTADDIIFTYYVLCDPSYSGPSTLSSYQILGLQDYQTQTTEDVFSKYETIAAAIQAAGLEYSPSERDSWTQAQRDYYWKTYKQVWKADIRRFVEFFASSSADEASGPLLSMPADAVVSSDGLRIALGMAALGLGSMICEGVFRTASGKTFDLNSAIYPTTETIYEEVYSAFGGDARAWAAAIRSDTDVPEMTSAEFINHYGPPDVNMNGQTIANIAGIKKIDEYTVEVTTTVFEAPAIYAILGITVAPLHYYGDKAQYDYADNKFGFTFGDLSGVQSKTSAPMGAGPYKFVKFEDKVVFFEANPNYYKGCPKLQNIQFREISEADKIAAVQSGAADIANPTGSKPNMDAIRSANGGETDGAVITTITVDFNGYGYIGLNADTVNVGSNPASEASKNLRKGFATLLAVYRDVSINSYYGDSAVVIDYPISNTSWAAPRKSDADYRVAFSEDVGGNNIYTSAMDAENKYTGALQAAIEFFKAAGFTYDEAAGRFTAAPEGAKLTYEALIAANGSGIHPNFQVLSNTAAALEIIGFTLEISDQADSSVILDRLNAGTQEIWVSAWGASVDPDMVQIYSGSGGSSGSNYYHIADPDLDQSMLNARISTDQAYRKVVYRECLNIVLDWAVEVPSYQRQDIHIFSTERVKMDTVTPAMTAYWGWMNDIERLEVYQAE